MNRSDAIALDASDPIAFARGRFTLPDGVIYLDGNSLGALPSNVPGRVADAIAGEWGTDLIRSWNKNGWWDAPLRAGDKLAPLLGAAAGQVAVGDSTSVNLFKQLMAACTLRPDQPVILTESGNFPTDLYIIDQVARLTGKRVWNVPGDKLAVGIRPEVAVVVATHVDYRSGRMHDMAGITSRAHEAGALMLWDLAHSAGAVPLELDACGVDLAVGCGYKYLNGGPGAPAFLYVNAALQESYGQPLSGWHGHARPFDFEPTYSPAAGIRRALTGTPPLLSMLALEAALAAFDGVTMQQLRAKSVALCDLFIELVEDRLGSGGFQLASPRSRDERGSQVSFSHPHAYAIMQALIEAGVIGDVRQPDILRFGFAPLYIRFADVYDAVDVLADIVATRRWNEPRFAARSQVT